MKEDPSGLQIILQSCPLLRAQALVCPYQSITDCWRQWGGEAGNQPSRHLYESSSISQGQFSGKISRYILFFNFFYCLFYCSCPNFFSLLPPSTQVYPSHPQSIPCLLLTVGGQMNQPGKRIRVDSKSISYSIPKHSFLGILLEKQIPPLPSPGHEIRNTGVGATIYYFNTLQVIIMHSEV